jgi:short-subunit dehydrogenase
MVELRGARALVTGAAGGLGGYISQALALEGANVCVSDLPGPRLDELAGELRGVGVEAQPVAADLTDADDRERLIREAEEAVGPLDVLVNNAGLEFGGGFLHHTREELEALTTVNLLAVMDLTRLVLPGMLERRRGHVVNVASLAGKLAPLYLATYGATKHGVVGFTHSLRAEYVDEPVSFSAICPVFVGRVGMYARSEPQIEDEPPPGFSTVPPERVADAVLSAIREDRAEVIVNRWPIRPLVGLYAMAPRTALRLLGNRRTRGFAEQYARARGRL